MTKASLNKQEITELIEMLDELPREIFDEEETLRLLEKEKRSCEAKIEKLKNSYKGSYMIRDAKNKDQRDHVLQEYLQNDSKYLALVEQLDEAIFQCSKAAAHIKIFENTFASSKIQLSLATAELMDNAARQYLAAAKLTVNKTSIKDD